MTFISDIKAPQRKPCEVRRICETIESLPPRDRDIMKGIVEMMLITAKGNNFQITEIPTLKLRKCKGEKS